MLRRVNKTKSLIKARPPMSTTELLIWIMILFSSYVKCMAFQFGTGLNSKPFLSSANINMYVSTLAILMTSISMVYILFNKRRLSALFIFHLVVTALLIGDTVYYRYYNGVITIPVITKMNISRISGVNDSIQSLYQLKDTLYLLDLPFIILFLRYMKRNRMILPVIRKQALQTVAVITVCMALIFSAITRSEVKAFAYSENYITKDLGVLFTHIDTTVSYTQRQHHKNNELNSEEIDELRNFYSSKNGKKGSYTGIATDMNIIIVQAESMQGFLIGEEINGQEITPNMNKLAGEGIYFDNIYYQTADGSTSDAEFMQYTSLYPMAAGSLFHDRTSNYFPSFARLLNNSGYDTYAFHAFEEDFWNRHEMYASLGFDRYIDHTYYEMDEYVGWMGQALSDASFFRQSLDMINTTSKFYASFITLSCHYPYSFFTDFPFDTGELDGSFLSDYIKGSNYADHALGLFIQDLKKRGLYENSLLVVFGDHKGVPKFHSEELMEFLSLEDNSLEWIKLQKIPLIMNHPHLDPQVVTNLGGQIDILPTIANLIGEELSYALGRDLLNGEERYVVLRDASVITEDYVYLNDTRELMDIKTGEPINLNKHQDEINSYLYELYISDLIVERNGLKEIVESVEDE